MTKKRKEKKKKITHSLCLHTKRADGYRMKWVTEYTFRNFLESITSRFGNRKAYSVFGDGEDKFISYNRLK